MKPLHLKELLLSFLFGITRSMGRYSAICRRNFRIYRKKYIPIHGRKEIILNHRLFGDVFDSVCNIMHENIHYYFVLILIHERKSEKNEVNNNEGKKIVPLRKNQYIVCYTMVE